MIRFESDYTEGAHPRILEALIRTNMEQTSGYGLDMHCENAANIIRRLCNRPEADVHFLVGGTQTNMTVIASALRPYQGVICAQTGHINIHETGAVEASGHKVLVLPSIDGTITAKQVEELCEEHYSDSSFEHMVQPGMVYISNPTENGTIYTKSELTALSRICKKYKLPLFLDGARLGYGIMAKGNDLSMEDIASLCDVFYIGGTKVGALFGEAVVITGENLKRDFRYHMKQRGGMLAKGRLLGIQFEELFTDKLYFEISAHADKLAMQIKKAFEEKNISFQFDSETNQQFPIITYEMAQKLSRKYTFSCNWEKLKKAPDFVRFCTSWATKEENVESLVEDIRRL